MNALTPTDDIVGPIVHQLALALSTYVTGIGRMYEEPPDGPPEDGSVIFPLTGFKFEDNDAIGKRYIRLKFGIRYMIKRSTFPDNLLVAYQYFSALSRVLSAWPVQTLNGLAIEVCTKEGAVTQLTVAGQPFLVLVLNVEVLTEINLITS
jgi:hypothetical protein